MSIHRRVAKSGRTTWVVRYRDPIPRERTFDRKADAERFERHVRHQLDTDQYLDPDSARITVREWSERWWPTIVHSQRAPSTISGYESALRLQVLPLSASAGCGRSGGSTSRSGWASSGAAGYSNSTIHAGRTVLGMIMTSASTPASLPATRSPASVCRRAPAGPATPSRSNTLRPWPSRRSVVAPLCARAGLLRPPSRRGGRPSPRDLDDLGRLTVERAISEHRGRLIERDTKTHRARVVQVPASVLSELREHLEAHVGPDPESPVFTTPADTRVRMSNWRHRVWDPQRSSSTCPRGPLPTCSVTRLRASWPRAVFRCRPPLPHWGTIRRSSFARTPICTRVICVASPTRWTSHVSRLERVQ